MNPREKEKKKHILILKIELENKKIELLNLIFLSMTTYILITLVSKSIDNLF